MKRTIAICTLAVLLTAGLGYCAEGDAPAALDPGATVDEAVVSLKWEDVTREPDLTWPPLLFAVDEETGDLQEAPPAREWLLRHDTPEGIAQHVRLGLFRGEGGDQLIAAVLVASKVKVPASALPRIGALSSIIQGEGALIASGDSGAFSVWYRAHSALAVLRPELVAASLRAWCAQALAYFPAVSTAISPSSEERVADEKARREEKAEQKAIALAAAERAERCQQLRSALGFTYTHVGKEFPFVVGAPADMDLQLLVQALGQPTCYRDLQALSVPTPFGRYVYQWDYAPLECLVFAAVTEERWVGRVTIAGWGYHERWPEVARRMIRP